MVVSRTREQRTNLTSTNKRQSLLKNLQDITLGEKYNKTAKYRRGGLFWTCGVSLKFAYGIINVVNIEYTKLVVYNVK